MFSNQPDATRRAVLGAGAAVAASPVLSSCRPTVVRPPGDGPLAIASTLWPNGGWPMATPESVGIDSRALLQMLQHIAQHQLTVDSVHVIRHGRLVLDLYRHPFQRDWRHDIASITKTVTALAIASLGAEAFDTPIFDASLGSSPDRARMRLRHLLANTSGLACGSDPAESELAAMQQAEDWVEFARQLPMAAEPGERFSYCSPGFHIASATVGHLAGQSLRDLAQTRLFTPLGVSEFVWPSDARGVAHGWGDLQMRPLDLARVGYLVLRGGQWREQRVLDGAALAELTASRSRTPSGDSYGLGVWLPRAAPGMLLGMGRGGQRMIIWPEADLLAVITGSGLEPDALYPLLLRALRSRSG